MESAAKSSIFFSRLYNICNALSKKLLSALLTHQGKPPSVLLLKFFLFDYFCAISFIVFLFVLFNHFYFTKADSRLSAYYNQLNIGFTTLLISTCSTYLFLKFKYPAFLSLVSFILPENTFAFRICILTNGLSFIYLTHGFLIPKYDPCISFYTFLNIMVIVSANAILCIIYLIFLVTGALQQFSNGIFTQFALILSPFALFIIQIFFYIAIDAFMLISDNFKTYVRQITVENRTKIFEDKRQKSILMSQNEV